VYDARCDDLGLAGPSTCDKLEIALAEINSTLLRLRKFHGFIPGRKLTREHRD
jgi:hypothetical protein